MEIPGNETDRNPDMVVGGERLNEQVKQGVCQTVVSAKEKNQDGGPFSAGWVKTQRK